MALTYKSIIKELEASTTLTLAVPADTPQDRTQLRLSQAKHRMGVEGKLSFNWAKTPDGWELTLVLHPSTTASMIPATIKAGGL
jgi:hypothetical protein